MTLANPESCSYYQYISLFSVLVAVGFPCDGGVSENDDKGDDDIHRRVVVWGLSALLRKGKKATPANICSTFLPIDYRAISIAIITGLICCWSLFSFFLLFTHFSLDLAFFTQPISSQLSQFSAKAFKPEAEVPQKHLSLLIMVFSGQRLSRPKSEKSEKRDWFQAGFAPMRH